MLDRCGYTVTDDEGIEQPCDRPATGWRWYQDVGEHEDALDVACDWHANEGGRRLAEAERLRAWLTSEAVVEAAVKAINRADRDADGILASVEDTARAALTAAVNVDTEGDHQ